MRSLKYVDFMQNEEIKLNDKLTKSYIYTRV